MKASFALVQIVVATRPAEARKAMVRGEVITCPISMSQIESLVPAAVCVWESTGLSRQWSGT